MSQSDLFVDNQTAPAFRNDLNNALQALATLSSGATAPSTTFANMLWYDTANNILKMRSEADDAWINVGYLCQSANKFCIFDNTNVVNTSGTQTGLLGDQSTATWEAGTGTTESLVSPAKVKAAIDALAPEDTEIGAGQSWSSVSLSNGIAVQNTEGRSIQISITVNSYPTGGDNNPIANASNVQVSGDGSTWITLGTTGSRTNTSSRVSVTAVVPDQHYYRFNGQVTNAAVLS